jgi:hypothetical protein
MLCFSDNESDTIVIYNVFSPKTNKKSLKSIIIVQYPEII